MNAKGRRLNRPIGGAPEIARPDKRQGAFIRALLEGASGSDWDKLKALFNELLPYEKQLAFVYAWFFDRWELLESDDEKEATETRVELQSLFGTHVGQLLRLALSEENKTQSWAGTILANIGSSVRKHDEKLSATNPAYLAEKKKIEKEKQLAQVLFPGPISEVAQRELKIAEGYRRRLQLLKAAYGKGWKEAARRQNIPEAYFPLAEFPDFSLKSKTQWEKWWKLLWLLIRKNNPVFLQHLREGRFPTLGIRYPAVWKSYRKDFRNVFKTIARLRDGGVL
jgi:hypothetical protein